jgi:hypothetical protein
VAKERVADTPFAASKLGSFVRRADIGVVCSELIVLKNLRLIDGQIADSLSILMEVDWDDGTEAGSTGSAVLRVLA